MISDIYSGRFPTLVQDHAHEKTSAKFGFVKTQAVLEVLADNGWFPSRVSEARSQKYRGFQTHVVRLQHKSRSNSPVIVGEYVPEIVLKNSHQGGSSFQLMWGIYRLVCSNGMTVGQDWGSQRIRHMGFAAEKVESAVRTMLETLPEVVGSVEGFRNTPLLDSQRVAFSKAAIELIKDESGKYSIAPSELLIPRRYEDRSDTSLWGTLNVVQENIIKGGIRRYTEDGRRYRTREVKSPDRDLKLNQALWTLAEALKASIQTGERL